MNAFVFALYREASATFLMFALALGIEGRGKTLAPYRAALAGEGRMVALFALAGVCSFGNVVGTVLALTMISSDVYSTYQPTIPVFTTSISVAVGYEVMTTWIAAGVTTSVAGAILIEVLGASDGGSGSVAGNILTAVQCLSMATLIVLTKPLLAQYTPLTVTCWYYAIGSVFTLVAALAAWVPADDFYWADVEPWAALVYAALIATLYAYEAYSWVIQYLSPTLVSAFCTLQPVFTVLLNFLFLGRGLGAPTAAAGIVVIAGLAVTVFGKAKRDARAARPLVEEPLLDERTQPEA